MTKDELKQDLEAKIFALQYSIERIVDVFEEVHGERYDGGLEDALGDLIDRDEHLTELDGQEEREVIPGTRIALDELSIRGRL